MIDVRLFPLLAALLVVALFFSARRVGIALAGRRDRRRAAEERELARMTGYIKKIRPDGTGPAIQRDRHGALVLFAGLRRYTPGGRKAHRRRRA